MPDATVALSDSGCGWRFLAIHCCFPRWRWTYVEQNVQRSTTNIRSRSSLRSTWREGAYSLKRQWSSQKPHARTPSRPALEISLSLVNWVSFESYSYKIELLRRRRVDHNTILNQLAGSITISSASKSLLFPGRNEQFTCTCWAERRALSTQNFQHPCHISTYSKGRGDLYPFSCNPCLDRANRSIEWWAQSPAVPLMRDPH